MKTPLLLTATVFTLSFTAASAAEPRQQPAPPASTSEPAQSETVRLRFVPDGGP